MSSSPLLKYVFPSLGVVVASLMFVSPLRAVEQAKADGAIGDLNPVPFPLIAANCAGWVAYSIVNRDVFVFLANAGGLMIGLYFTLVAYGLTADANTRHELLGIMLLFTLLLEIVGFTGVKSKMSDHDLKLLWGFTSNAILLIFYMSPLSTLLEVFKSRSSASLNPPLSIMTVVNGSLWVGYGLAISDYFIWVPNGIGAALGCIQLALLWVFPRPRGEIYRRQHSTDITPHLPTSSR